MVAVGALGQLPAKAVTTADAGGAGQVTFYPIGGTDWVITRTSLFQDVSGLTPVPASPAQPTAIAYHNGIEQEGSESGGLDSSDTRFVLNPGDEYKVVFAGAQPGARLTVTLRVVQYPANQAPLE